MRVSVIRKLYERIPDCVWPHLTGDVEPTPEDQDIFSAEHGDSLEVITSLLSSRLVQLEERIRGVESKLLALLTLTSVLSTAVAASLAAATTLGSVKEDAKLLAWFAVFLVFYAAIQILRSLWATVDGLVRRGYKQLSPDDIFPQSDEANDAYRIRLLNLQVNHLNWNERVVNEKVSCMAVAHTATALKNALTAIFCLVLLTLGIAAYHLI